MSISRDEVCSPRAFFVSKSPLPHCVEVLGQSRRGARETSLISIEHFVKSVPALRSESMRQSLGHHCSDAKCLLLFPLWTRVPPQVRRGLLNRASVSQCNRAVASSCSHFDERCWRVRRGLTD